MSWKDYFYFQKQDKVAIILLLLIIVLCGGFYMISAAMPSGNVVQKVGNVSEVEQFRTKVDSLQELKYDKPIKLKEGNTININKADTLELRKIPGVGAVLATRIIEHRSSIGGYTNLEQLKDVKGIKEKLYVKINKYVSLQDAES